MNVHGETPAARVVRSTLQLALAAFVAMTIQDCAATGMVIAEAHLNAPLAALGDTVQWAAGLLSAGLALDEIIRKGFTRRARWICASLAVANVAGTYLGVFMGRSLLHS